MGGRAGCGPPGHGAPAGAGERRAHRTATPARAGPEREADHVAATTASPGRSRADSTARSPRCARPAASHHAVRCLHQRSTGPAGRARRRSIVDVIVPPVASPLMPVRAASWVDWRRVAPTPDLPPYRPGFADLAPVHDCGMTRIGEGRRSGGRAIVLAPQRRLRAASWPAEALLAPGVPLHHGRRHGGPVGAVPAKDVVVGDDPPEHAAVAGEGTPGRSASRATSGSATWRRLSGSRFRPRHRAAAGARRRCARWRRAPRTSRAPRTTCSQTRRPPDARPIPRGSCRCR